VRCFSELIAAPPFWPARTSTAGAWIFIAGTAVMAIGLRLQRYDREAYAIAVSKSRVANIWQISADKSFSRP
jgi:hypothetical protein